MDKLAFTFLASYCTWKGGTYSQGTTGLFCRTRRSEIWFLWRLAKNQSNLSFLFFSIV